MSKEAAFADMSSFEDIESEPILSIRDRIIRKLKSSKHFILTGPPGTGKTKLVLELFNGELEEVQIGITRLVQFHPQYAYQDFIEGYSVSDGAFHYKQGLFLKFLGEIEAKECNSRTNILVIDEINRADISSIFGELMTLLDDSHNKEITLPISEDKISFEGNFIIIGTMNSADKNIAVMDFALRRRFDFIFVPPDYEGMLIWLNNHGFSFDEFDIESYVLFARTINSRIIACPLLGKNMTLGQALFVPKKAFGEQITLADICEMIVDKIVPQIEAYLGKGNNSELASVLSPDVRQKLENGIEISKRDVINLINSCTAIES